MSQWQWVKDVLLTLAGLGLILSQVFSPRPSTEFLVTGLALTGLGATLKVGSIVSWYIGERPSPPKSLPRSRPSGNSPEDDDE